MDDRRFDSLARSLASCRSRRQVLRGVLGIGGGALATATGHSADAARRQTPTPRPASCPGNQYWDGSTCICPDDYQICGPACCPNGQAECCDGACCYGSCYGEELCCPAGNILCDGACQPWECCNGSDCPSGSCTTDHVCCVQECDGMSWGGSDGCGGICACAPGLLSCENGTCGACCSDSELASEQCVDLHPRSDAACWQCASNTCQARPGGTPCDIGYCSWEGDGFCHSCARGSDICSIQFDCCKGDCIGGDCVDHR